MATDREKEREAELESAMYTNCLLLGLDPAVLGSPAGAAAPRVGLFRHSNPRLGEQLLYFLLSSLRGPAQSAKDFDKVWPIFDSAQSREFRKVVKRRAISDIGNDDEVSFSGRKRSVRERLGSNVVDSDLYDSQWRNKRQQTESNSSQHGDDGLDYDGSPVRDLSFFSPEF